MVQNWPLVLDVGLSEGGGHRVFKNRGTCRNSRGMRNIENAVGYGIVGTMP